MLNTNTSRPPGHWTRVGNPRRFRGDTNSSHSHLKGYYGRSLHVPLSSVPTSKTRRATGQLPLTSFPRPDFLIVPWGKVNDLDRKELGEVPDDAPGRENPHKASLGIDEGQMPVTSTRHELESGVKGFILRQGFGVPCHELGDGQLLEVLFCVLFCALFLEALFERNLR